MVMMEGSEVIRGALSSIETTTSSDLTDMGDPPMTFTSSGFLSEKVVIKSITKKGGRLN